MTTVRGSPPVKVHFVCIRFPDFPDSVLRTVAETKLNNMKKTRHVVGVHVRRYDDREQVEVIPYILKLSHNLKKVDTRHRAQWGVLGAV